MSDLLNHFDAFFAGEKPCNTGGAFGQQIGNESYRVVYTGSQREVLRERIEQLEAQLANARKDALEEVLIISAKVVQSHEKQMHGDETAFDEGYVLAIGQLQREILKLKEKP